MYAVEFLHPMRRDNIFYFQRACEIPTSHSKLVELAKDLMQQLESSRMAKDVFSSEPVQKALDESIDLIIRTAQEIKHCYEKSKISM